MKIAVENSTWNNIGDAFYQTALQTMLADALPDDEVFSFDGPIVRAFRPRRFEANSFDAREMVEADHFVLSGPILGAGFLAHYGPLIQAIVESGRSYSLLSLHAYSEGEELERTKAFLRAFPPRALETRDEDTFVKVEGLASTEKNGCCFAFFVKYIPDVPQLARSGPYICLSFHNSPEPEIRVGDPAADFFNAGFDVGCASSGWLPWKVRRHFDFMAQYPRELGGCSVVRPVHSFYPLPHLSFSRPNSYISYNPRNFLAIYRNCEGVITDRVHAGVAALSFGKPALVTKLDGRYALFKRAPLERKGDVVRLEPGALDALYAEHMAWLRTSFRDAIHH